MGSFTVHESALVMVARTPTAIIVQTLPAVSLER